MKRILSVISIFLLLSVFGCTQSEVEEDGVGVHALKDVKATFNLEVADGKLPETRSLTFTAHGSTQADTLAVGAAPDTLQTRSAVALPDAQEKKVAGLWIGQYNGAGTKLLSSQYIESVTAPDAGGQVNVTVKLKKYDNCRIRFVANAGDLGSVETEALLDERTIPYESTADGRPSSNLFAMTALWTGDITGGTAQQNLTPVVTLTRLAAKITFTYSVNGTGFSFTPTALRLEQVPDRSQIGIPDPDNPVRPADATYTRSYTGTLSSTGATVYWYLPENMAGTAKAPDAVHSEKEKVGNGVTDPTCIVLTGNAVQNGTKYENVTYRFYPGKNHNAYNIDRNSHYIMNISLKGLDISDKRITVSDIPPIMVDGKIPAAAGSSREVICTSRPGVVWSLLLPSWLSATIDGQTIPAGATLINQGPCPVTFTAIQANPSGTERSETFTVAAGNGEHRSFTLVQEGSSFSISAPTLQLTEYTATSGKVTLNGTPGLVWTVTSSGETNGITPVLSSAVADGTDQTLTFNATANPKSNRLATFQIGVKGGSTQQTVVVKQPADPVVVIDQHVLQLYAVQVKTAKTNGNWDGYPPFDMEGSPHHPGISDGDITLSDSPSMNNKSYSIQVERLNESPIYKTYADVKTYCTGLREGQHSDWRIPTQIELVAMWNKCKGENMNATDDDYASTTLGAKFVTIEPDDLHYYWSSSDITFETNYKSKLSFKTGLFTSYNIETRGYIRCVRDLP